MSVSARSGKRIGTASHVVLFYILGSNETDCTILLDTYVGGTHFIEGEGGFETVDSTTTDTVYGWSFFSYTLCQCLGTRRVTAPDSRTNVSLFHTPEQVTLTIYFSFRLLRYCPLG